MTANDKRPGRKDRNTRKTRRSVHEATIRLLVAKSRGIKIRKFRATLQEVLERTLGAEGDIEQAMLFAKRIRPDAYKIDEAGRIVTIFEVEDTSPLSAAKLELLGNLWFFLDCEEWQLRVVTLDRYGNRASPGLRVGEFFYAGLDNEADAPSEYRTCSRCGATWVAAGEGEYVCPECLRSVAGARPGSCATA